MPEGDTIFRAARTLDRALKGETVREFRTVLARLARADENAPVAGRTIDRVDAAGKHLLVHFSGDLVLRSHMRMHGSWHIYRRGERWRMPGHTMRVAIITDGWEAIGFNIPVAEFLAESSLERHEPIRRLGPDLLADDWDEDEALRRVRSDPAAPWLDVLLDQTRIAGIGNVYKSEILFLNGLHPLTPVGASGEEAIRNVLADARKLLKINVIDPMAAPVTWHGPRRTTGRSNPGERTWVYGRGGQPCRRCGTLIERGLLGRDARPTYWCPRCQSLPGN